MRSRKDLTTPLAKAMTCISAALWTKTLYEIGSEGGIDHDCVLSKALEWSKQSGEAYQGQDGAWGANDSGYFLESRCI